MTPEQIRIVQRTWSRVLPAREAAAKLFYERLFEIDPSLRRLFRGDMRAQGEKLMQVMDAAVNGINRLEKLYPAVEELGRRHIAYGVEGHHYGAVGAALLWTLDKTLGSEFTPEVKDAWATIYGVLARKMRVAGADATT